MVFLFLVITGLFFCNATMNSMNVYRDINYMPITEWDEHGTEAINYSKDVIIKQPSKEKVKRYAAQGVNNIVIKGVQFDEKDKSNRIQVQLRQIIDDNSSEEIRMSADKKIFNDLAVSRDGENLEIILHDTHATTVVPSRNIVILLALKKYAKIVTEHCVDTTFLSSIHTDKLHIQLLSGAVMNMHDNTCLDVNDLLYIYVENKSKIALAVKTKLLQAQGNTESVISVKGVAEKQELRFFDCSFLAHNLQSKDVRIALGEGKGDINLWSEGMIGGVVDLKAQHEWDFCVHSKSDIILYPAEKI